MDKQPHGVSLKRANWKFQYGPLAVTVLSVVCLIDSPVRATQEADLGDMVEPILNQSITQDGPDFDWTKLVAGPDLNYTACYKDLQCAKLELPMDYWNSSVKDKISLAVIRKPAKVNVTSPRYGGAIQLNPGGPGLSGIGMVLTDGEDIHKIVDTQDTQTGKYFDLLSFDPRGVGHTTPQMTCDLIGDMAHSLKVRRDHWAGDIIDLEWSWQELKGQECSQPVKIDQADIRKYMTTRCVAQDMASLVEAHGRWRQQEGERVMAKDGRSHNQTDISKPWRYGVEKLQYWGFSYGSHLGTTFAALHPGQVERMVIDGVVDAEDYTKGLENHDLDDAEKAMEQFYSNCARAGYPQCRLANKTDTNTADGVKARVQNTLRKLEDRGGISEFVGLSTTISKKIKFPSDFSDLATYLAALETTAGRHHAHQSSRVGNNTSSDEPYKLYSSAADTEMTNIWNMAISCTDGNDQKGVSKGDLEKHVEQLQKQSPTFWPIMVPNLLSCIHYNVTSERRFIGPWTGNTSHPILLVGNTADPVTPLRNAIKMAAGFQGAVVLIQNSTGHGSWSSSSNCTDRNIRKYFQSGELPANNTVCEPNNQPFDVEFNKQPNFSLGLPSPRHWAAYLDAV